MHERCLSCLHRNRGLCGRLLSGSLADAGPRDRPRWQEFETVKAGASIVKQGYLSRFIYVLCDGWAFRFFRTADGARQILNFLLSGNLFSSVGIFAERFPCAVDALSQVQFCRFDRVEVLARLEANPAISAAIAESYAAEQNTSDELLTVIGKRSAAERVAYLLLHLTKRLTAYHVIRDHCYPFALRQQHIADAAGLTVAHVNRVIGGLRRRRVIELSDGVLKILDLAELERLGSLEFASLEFGSLE